MEDLTEDELIAVCAVLIPTVKKLLADREKNREMLTQITSALGKFSDQMDRHRQARRVPPAA